MRRWAAMPFDFVGSLPAYCANKRALVRILGAHLPNGKYGAQLFNIPLSTFYTYVESNRQQLNMDLLLATRHESEKDDAGGANLFMSADELADFKLFLEETCMTPSGSKTDKFTQTLPMKELYKKKFKVWRSERNERRLDALSEEDAQKCADALLEDRAASVRDLKVYPIRCCYDTFKKVLEQQFKVRPSKKYWGWAMCPTCGEGGAERKLQPLREQLQLLEQQSR
jgi:hypothetical protein